MFLQFGESQQDNMAARRQDARAVRMEQDGRMNPHPW